MRIDDTNKIIKNELNKFTKLKKIFTQLYDAELLNSRKRIEYFENLFQIREDNEGLKKINDIFREEMKRLEKDREKHLEIMTSLIIPVIDMYPTEIKRQKKNMDDLAVQRKNMEKMRASTSEISKSERSYEDGYRAFQKNITKDSKYLLMHYIYSELKNHSAALERLTNLFFKINNIEPLIHLKKFGEDLEINNYDFRKLNLNMDEIEEKEKYEKEKEDKEKDEVYSDEEEEDNDEEGIIRSKNNFGIKYSIKLTKSRRTDKKKSTNTKISESQKEDDKEKDREKVKESIVEKSKIEEQI